MRRIPKILAILSLASLTACERAGRFDDDRADATYRAAMADYQAGRLKEAIEGFRRVCAERPGNASARFQLACLLQDSARDYLNAYGAYQEYLAQRPESDKAALAKTRRDTCERELAKALSEKYAPESTREAEREFQELRASLTRAQAEVERLQASLRDEQGKVASLTAEYERLKKFVREESVAEEKAQAPEHEELDRLRALLDEDRERGASGAEDLDDVKRLMADDAAQNAAPLAAGRERPAVRTVPKGADETPAATTDAPADVFPKTYVVQDGDTLYKIAIRFYGRASLWSRIREANRATISTDGRLKTGQTIVLPKIP